MMQWLDLVQECGNFAVTIADGGRCWGQAVAPSARSLSVLEAHSAGEATWAGPETARGICEFASEEPSVPGKWTRLYELGAAEVIFGAIEKGRNPWAIRNPSAIYGKALTKAKRLRNTGSIVVLIREERALILASKEVLEMLAARALTECDFDQAHREALAAMQG